MILDTSAIVAMLLAEPGVEELAQKLEDSSEVGVGTPTLLEAAVVVSARTRADQRGTLETFLRQIGAVEIPFGEEHWRQAHGAFWRFGKGRHPAGLNFGDCCAYAVAKVAGRPLLCKGDDFRRTDLPLA